MLVINNCCTFRVLAANVLAAAAAACISAGSLTSSLLPCTQRTLLNLTHTLTGCLENMAAENQLNDLTQQLTHVLHYSSLRVEGSPSNKDKAQHTYVVHAQIYIYVCGGGVVVCGGVWWGVVV